MTLETLANLRRIQLRIRRLLQRTAQRSAQLLGILLPGANLCGGVRMIGQPGVEDAPIGLAELMVDVRVQVAFAGGMLII